MKHFCLLCSMILVAISSSHAQSLEECHKLASEHYPEIKQYDLISLTEQYNLSNAAKAWLPQISISGQASYQSATPTYPEAFKSIMQANGMDMVGIRKDQYKIGIDVSQNIWDGGKSKASKAITIAEANEQRLHTDVSLYDLQARVNNIYFGILLLEERITQTNALIALLDNNLSRMRTYHNNGVATQADVDIIEAELLTAKQTLNQLESSRASYRHMLETFIGKPLTSEKLERPTMTSISSRTSARPELDFFNAQKNKIDAQRNAINASLMPQVSAFAQGYYGYPGMDMFKSMRSADWSLNAIIGVKMSWNFGAFYTKNNNIEKLNIAQKQIDIQRDVFLFNTEIQTTHYDEEIIRLRKTIEEDSRIVELRSNVRMAAESQLKNGVIDATDLLRKITDETTASINRSTHEIELLQAIYNLKNILNQ